MKIFLCFILVWIGAVSGYKPVILVHGVNSGGSSLDDLKNYIQEANPGTSVTSINAFDNVLSFLPLDTQIPGFEKKLLPIMQAAPDGVNLICHSQGGLVCRGIIEMMPDHNIKTLITLSSPLFGQFGIPPVIQKRYPFFQKKTRYEISKFIYDTWMQNLLSIANYWRDPRPSYFKEFEDNCKFLPILDNNPRAKNYQKDVATSQKKNFLKLNKLVALGGPDDGVINPWQSSVFAYLGPDAKTIVPMRKQELYLQDWFGLRTLDERGGVTCYEVAGVKHSGWHHNKTIFDTYVRKWLD